jgi:hypothetical protein
VPGSLTVSARIVLSFRGIARLHLGIEAPAVTASSRHIYLNTVGARNRARSPRRLELVTSSGFLPGLRISACPWRGR